MKAEKAVLNLLLADAGVAALVNARIYMGITEEGTDYPCVTIERISGQRVVRSQMAASDPGIVDARLQVTAWGSSYESVKTVADAVRIALERYAGAIAGVTVWDIVPETDGPDLYDNDLKLYGAPADYTVTHPE